MDIIHTPSSLPGNNQIEMYETHAPLRMISIVTSRKWYAVEQSTPVNADDQMLQILAAGAQGVDDEAESLDNNSSDTEEEEWDNQEDIEQ